MRPLTINRDDDRGAVLVWVALMLTVLLGMGALVIDVGALYAERRELQNGADAAALAVAADCAVGSCNDGSRADAYADLNASDGWAWVDEVCGDGLDLDACTPPPGISNDWVRVTTSTENPDKSREVDFLLAPVLESAIEGGTVHASAVAAWGLLGKATTLPITFSVCEFQALGGKVDGSKFPEFTGPIYLHKNDPLLVKDCPSMTSSGQNLPGGFGWLKDSDGSDDCNVTVGVGDDTVGSDTGNNVPNPCDPDEWLNEDVLIPLYDDCVMDEEPEDEPSSKGPDKKKSCDTGNNGGYHIVGFAGFTVLGFKLPGHHAEPNSCTGGAACLYGKFTHIAAIDGETGSGTDFGARAVTMIG